MPSCVSDAKCCWIGGGGGGGWTGEVVERWEVTMDDDVGGDGDDES